MAKLSLSSLLQSAIASQREGLENLRTLKNIPNQMAANALISGVVDPQASIESSMRQVMESTALTGPTTQLVNTLAKQQGIRFSQAYDPSLFFDRPDVAEAVQQGFSPTDIAVQSVVPGEFVDQMGFEATPKAVLADVLRIITDPLLVAGVGRAAIGKAVFVGAEVAALEEILGTTRGAKDDDSDRFKGSILE